ncbi:GntR family transcriptional regulator [Alteribacillus iranensis]|uniref:DNA-binding transcriptional regulator, GntR family n=1 Tax=Alteribacillus iranensis TaxID=930128 RepID=A0A1I2E4Z7_9BACI|nr:GntR family transcriptional regulator [Alteribacillus iranensis]SFE87787.1 DNA-binding transcriptional regulator, GntR family [Alteribacillus iranensis]
MEQWAPENLLSIRERAYFYLKNLILEGEYKTGDRLIERELAEKLNISRTPIREALFRLESQGFVKTVPRKGVVVASISTEDVIEVFTILSSLEVLAAKLAAQKVDENTKKELDVWIHKMENALQDDTEEISNLHIEISHVLYKAAKSPKLYEMLVDLMDYIRAFADVGRKVQGREDEAMKEHLAVLKAVRDEEVEMAEYLTKIHIENSKKAYLDAIDHKKGE